MNDEDWRDPREAVIGIIGDHRSNARVPARCYGCDWRAEGNPVSFPEHVANILIQEGLVKLT